MELALVLRLQSAVLVRLKRARFVLSRRGRRRLLPALRSRANFSSSAGFNGFSKEIATTGPTNSLRKSRFRVVARRPRQRRRLSARRGPTNFAAARDCSCRSQGESTAVALSAASVLESGTLSAKTEVDRL